MAARRGWGGGETGERGRIRRGKPRRVEEGILGGED